MPLSDIIAELDKPGRDPRRYIEMMEFDAKVKTMNDLQEGMVLNGIVTNITQFGCFVDIGIKTDWYISRKCPTDTSPIRPKSSLCTNRLKSVSSVSTENGNVYNSP